MQFKHVLTACLTGCAALVFAATAALAQLATVTVPELNVRQGPSTSSRVTYVLRQGAEVEIIRRQGSWAYVVGSAGGEGWVFAQYLSTSAPTPPPSGGQVNNEVFRSSGTIENARYNGRGDANLVLVRRENGASLGLTAGGFSIEYLGTIRSNFEGTVQVQVDRFRSSEMGYRTVPVSGTCDIQASTGTVRRAFCTISGSGVDHGRSNYTAR